MPTQRSAVAALWCQAFPQFPSVAYIAYSVQLVYLYGRYRKARPTLVSLSVPKIGLGLHNAISYVPKNCFK